VHRRTIQINHQPDATIFQFIEKFLHQVGDLFELNVKLWCQKVNMGIIVSYRGRSKNLLRITSPQQFEANS
jgi:hypothetical protein